MIGLCYEPSSCIWIRKKLNWQPWKWWSSIKQADKLKREWILHIYWKRMTKIWIFRAAHAFLRFKQTKKFNLYFSIKFNQYRTLICTDTQTYAFNHLLILLINNMELVFSNPHSLPHLFVGVFNHLFSCSFCARLCVNQPACLIRHSTHQTCLWDLVSALS